MAPPLDYVEALWKPLYWKAKRLFLIASLMEDRIASVTVINASNDAIEDRGQHQRTTIVIAHFMITIILHHSLLYWL